MTKISLRIAFLVAFFTYNVLAVDNIPSRSLTSCGYVGGKIYCFGGDTSSSDIMSLQIVDENLYSLDINSFGAQKTYNMNSAWNKIVPAVDFNTENRGTPSSVVLSDGKRFMIQGGYNIFGFSYTNQTIIYDTSSNTWSKGTQFTDEKGGPKQVYRSTAVSLSDDSIGFYGGLDQFSPSSETYSFGGYTGFSLFTMLNVNSGIWSSYSPQSSTLSGFYPSQQTATLNPSTGKVYYLGGSYVATENMLASTMLFFRWASVFNTNSGDWLNETLNGDVPTDRMYHTATLLPNSQDILLYGGSNDGIRASGNYCYTLNLETNTWTMNKNVGVPSQLSGPRYFHSAVLVDFVLFILFGRSDSGDLGFPLLTIDVSNVSNIVYTDTYVSTTNVTTNTTTDPTINSTESGGLSKGAIGGIAAGAVVAGLGVIAFIFFCLRRRNNAKRIDTHEQMTVDWDAIEDHYREVPAAKPNLQHNLIENNNESLQRIDKITPDIAVNIVKPSVIQVEDYDTVKPDVK